MRSMEKYVRSERMKIKREGWREKKERQGKKGEGGLGGVWKERVRDVC